MKKRNKLYSNLMLVPPMVLLALVWSPGSSAFDLTSHLPDFLTKRTLAVDTETQEKEVTKPEDIVLEDVTEVEQKSIEEAATEVVKHIEGALPLHYDIENKTETKEEISLEVKIEEKKEIALEAKAEEKKEISLEVKAEEKKEKHIKKKKNKKKKDQVTCEKEEKKKTLTEEVVEQERDIMAQYQDFFKAVMVPMMANYISSQNFKAPQLDMGFAGIPAQNTNYGAGLGLNLLSLSDYYNSRSLGFGGSTTINNYNVTGDYYNGAYTNSSSMPQNQFNPMMSEQMFSSATASPYGFNFGSMAIQDHSRFDQMNAQNVPAIQSVPVVAPIMTGPAPATVQSTNIQPVIIPNLSTSINTVGK